MIHISLNLMENSNLQIQIRTLQSKADELFHLGESEDFVYGDALSRLNHEIHQLINGLWNQEGSTLRENAELCLALLLGYSGCMYANPEDDARRDRVFARTKELLTKLPTSQLKDQLSAALHNIL